MRKALILIATVAMALVAGASPAAADGSGFCSIGGVKINMNVKESPHEGSVKYISMSSTLLLDLSNSTQSSTRSQLYYELPDNTDPLLPVHYAYSADVAGNGLYNYRIDYNWDGEGLPFTQAGRAKITAEKANSSLNCSTNVYF